MPTVAQPQANGPAASPKSQDRLAFLRALYGAADTGYWFNVSTFPDGRTRPFPAAESGIVEADEYINVIDDGTRHVFTSMAIFDHEITSGRGKAADVAALTCLWIDLDVKPGALPSMDVARAIVESIPLRPSLLTCSGGGMHAFYIFKEPLSLESDSARAEAVDLLSRWKATAMSYAAEHGGSVDKGTFDPARVMRVSGTLNPKSQPPLPAYILEDNGLRYAESDFDPFLRDAVAGVATAAGARTHVAPVSLDGVDISPLETLPPVFAEALESDSRLRLTWKCARTDLVDQSHSSYSLAIANACVSLGLTDEHIAQVLCTWRALNEAKPKEPEWYGRTIAKARSFVGIASETATFMAQVSDDTVTDHDVLLSNMSDLVGARIVAVKRYPDIKRAVYRVQIGDHAEVELGDARDCLDQTTWASVLWDSGHRLKKLKAPVWDRFCDMMLKVIEDIDPESVTERGQAEGWVDDFISRRKVAKISAHEAYQSERPWYGRDGLIHIYVDHLFKAINRPGQKAISKGRDYHPAMKSIGAVMKAADLRKQGIQGVKMWVLPEGYGERGGDDE